MKLTPVIAALRARCPYFENRVAGAAQFKNLPEVGKLKLPAAYVVPGDDSPGENKSQTDYWQELKEGFSVVVILSNGRDERGQFASYDVVDDVRQMLFKALLGWNPEACGNPITYDGGTLLDLNRHELIYQFDFSVISELTEDDTRQQDDLNSLDELQTLAIDVDYLEPGKRTGVLKAIFGDDAETLQVVNALIDKGKDGYDQIQQKMNKQASLNKRVQAQLGTLSNLWEAMTGTATNGLAAIGGAFSGDAKNITQWLSASAAICNRAASGKRTVKPPPRRRSSVTWLPAPFVRPQSAKRRMPLPDCLRQQLLR